MTIEHVDNAIINALKGKSNLDESVLSIRGFSTPTMRHLFNNICNIDGNYLEVGLYCGATFCSSFNKNIDCIGIENYSQSFEVNTVKEELENNIKNHSHKSKNGIAYFGDCFSIDIKSSIKNIDIYFYDGEHSEESQAKALPHFIDSMADRFLFIVDDTNWQSVALGTQKGFEQLEDKITLENCWIMKGEKEQDDPIWHNGLTIFLISKK